MGLFRKFRSYFNFSTKSATDTESKKPGEKGSHGKQMHSLNPDDPYLSLTEVAAPEPVQRHSEQGHSRHNTLEQHLTNVSSNNAKGGEGQYGALSEIAAPQPVGEERAEAEMARHPSLEQSLSEVKPS